MKFSVSSAELLNDGVFRPHNPDVEIEEEEEEVEELESEGQQHQETDNENAQTRPTRIVTMARTFARTGRSIKNFENMGVCHSD